MKKIGIVGGTAWLSTVDYYATICELSERHHASRGFASTPPTPEMSIESLDLNRALSYIGTIGDEESWEKFDAYHRDALRRLEASGADFAIIASNTPHHRFGAITSGIRMPVISIFEAVAKECACAGIKQVLVLGTALTMNSSAIREALKGYDVEAFAPNDEERMSIVNLIDKLQAGTADGTSERISQLSKAAFGRRSRGRPVACLACTELPLAFSASKRQAMFEADGVLYVNTSAIHARAAFNFAVA